MEKTATLPAAVMPKAVTAAPAVAKKKEHLMVEMVHGISMAIVMFSVLTLWWEFLEFGLASIKA